MHSLPFRLTEAAPGAEPLTLDEAKAHLRVMLDTDDALIAGLIAAARQACESFTGRALISRACSLWLDAWPRPEKTERIPPFFAEYGTEVELPRAPLISVTAVNIYDETGAATVFSADNYYADIPSGRIALKRGVMPPLPLRNFGGIEIQFRAGYGSGPQNVPSALRQGMLRLVAHLYEHRGDDPAAALTASGAGPLFQPYRVLRL